MTRMLLEDDDNLSDDDFDDAVSQDETEEPETLKIKKTARRFIGPDFADADEEEDEEKE